MEFVALPLAVMGFIFGMAAYTQANSLKDKVGLLEKEIEELKTK